MRSSAVKVGARCADIIPASSAPTRNVIKVPALPSTAWRIAGSSWCRYPLDQVAVRIDYGKPPGSIDVLPNETGEQGRFAHARFADHVHMGQAIRLFDAERSVASMKGGFGEIRDRVWIEWHRFIVQRA